MGGRKLLGGCPNASFNLASPGLKLGSLTCLPDPGERAAPRALTHTRTALLTSPLHPETLRAPSGKPLGYEGHPPPQGADTGPQTLPQGGLASRLEITRKLPGMAKRRVF